MSIQSLETTMISNNESTAIFFFKRFVLAMDLSSASANKLLHDGVSCAREEPSRFPVKKKKRSRIENVLARINRAMVRQETRLIRYLPMSRSPERDKLVSFVFAASSVSFLSISNIFDLHLDSHPRSSFN